MMRDPSERSDPAPAQVTSSGAADAPHFAALGPVTDLDADDVRYLFRAAHDWLARHYEMVNRLNVFPVPDGDTGTNMLLTLKAAMAAMTTHPDETGDGAAGHVVARAATGAHHGSRGNSGVIFGQMLQGWSQALAGRERLTVPDLAAALQHASDVAYASVPSPVEGTILTVGRAVSQAAAHAAVRGRDVREFLRHVVDAADAAVRRTPELLPVLREAGVVDSGGKGLFLIYEGMYRALTGADIEDNPDAGLAAVAEAEIEHALEKGKRALPPVRWGFDVQFLVEQPNKPVAAILEDIRAMGEYPLVEGDDTIVKVHVHVFDPGVPLSYAVRLGFVSDVVVENMDDMAAAAHLVPETAAAPETDVSAAATSALSLAPGDVAADDVGVIAVAPGPGFTDLFHALGAQAVVSGGQTMNPSVADLAAAVATLPCRRVVILPNNRNVIMAANQVAALLADEAPPRTVRVLPTTTVPQGIAAMLSYRPDAPVLDDLAAAMADAAAQVVTGEVTRAVRDATIDGVAVQAGSVIGLVDGALVIAAETVEAVVDALLARMVTPATEVVTLYRGEAVAEHAGENLAQLVRDRYPELDIEPAYGGQPHYVYILSAE